MRLDPARARKSAIVRLRESLSEQEMASHLEFLRRDGEQLDPDKCAICFVIAERQAAALHGRQRDAR